jgi:hypothetical protein
MVNNTIVETTIIPKKRGRKPKSDKIAEPKEEIKNIITVINTNIVTNEEPVVMKKRGRKPKGGKIIQQINSQDDNASYKQNIILHLKCSLKDLENENICDTNIECYNINSQKNDNYEQLEYNNILSKKYYIDPTDNSLNEDIVEDKKGTDIRDIWEKLKLLEHNLHTNNINNKKSACFWCTYDFDNPPIYIPKHHIENTYHVYGCFCSPECATAYLLKENIDTSSKFERYHLLNHIYCKIYEYNKNINPAPNPYYTLEKYYGNLSIQEYRLLLKNERLFLVVDKPLTRILPELHEDNDDFSINNKIITSNAYKIKKKDSKTQNKNLILTEKFGLSNK